MNHWVVIASAAPAKYLNLCLDSIFMCEPDPRVCVVLDHPEITVLDSLAFMCHARVDVIWNQASTRHNVSANWNIGINHAMRYNPDVITILNDDTVMGMENGLNTLAELALRENAIVGPLTNEPGGIMKQLVTRHIKDSSLMRWPLDHAPNCGSLPEVLEPDPPGSVNGFCMTIPARRIRQMELGVYFDEKNHPILGNEDEFQAWARNNGIRSLICPRVFVWHWKGVCRDKMPGFDKYKVENKVRL
jgi:GT2 family glycosyltransferase